MDVDVDGLAWRDGGGGARLSLVYTIDRRGADGGRLVVGIAEDVVPTGAEGTAARVPLVLAVAISASELHAVARGRCVSVGAGGADLRFGFFDGSLGTWPGAAASARFAFLLPAAPDFRVAMRALERCGGEARGTSSSPSTMMTVPSGAERWAPSAGAGAGDGVGLPPLSLADSMASSGSS
ncbi:hypothetical protein GN958_ATG04486 [Phytophthora infestans]|uniref:Uncharacterized protein n=1 Tax=Phytophthora infestans TaxID=4787 RepID=A0A8S9V016_PHYIN|nr:hypothetical protein GN958_ATG04486 [Phytophthora infestans]